MLSKQTLDARSFLRKELRDARRKLTIAEHEEASRGVMEQLNALSLLNNARTVAGYLVNDGEVNLKPYIDSQWETHPPKHFSLPVLHPICKGHLLFLSYSRHTKLVKNKYNIEEPALSCQSVIPTSQCDVILMPLVGFDLNGNRLGMGGGYYDRTLAFTQTTTGFHNPLCPSKPKIVGIAHDVQEVHSLPVAPWDVPLDAIVTPTRTLRF